MIKFVNAKLNLGLNITERRPDGYHNLETIFLPVGIYNGTPENPEPFCDILEITPNNKGLDFNNKGLDFNNKSLDLNKIGFDFEFAGNTIDCPPEKNLVVRAANAFAREAAENGIECDYSIRLEKHLPDGAGMGGGSADATFTYLSLSELTGFSPKDPIGTLAKLGADCPFFVENKPVYAEGIGEMMTPVEVLLDGYWAVILKPDVYVSTKEAFAGITPKQPDQNLRELVKLPIEEWRDRIVNDFESSLFPKHPILAEYKEALYNSGAKYASMSGSGSSLYGLFENREKAVAALESLRVSLNPIYSTICKL